MLKLQPTREDCPSLNLRLNAIQVGSRNNLSLPNSLRSHPGTVFPLLNIRSTAQGYSTFVIRPHRQLGPARKKSGLIALVNFHDVPSKNCSSNADEAIINEIMDSPTDTRLRRCSVWCSDKIAAR